jgi:hypothetical protein
MIEYQNAFLDNVFRVYCIQSYFSIHIVRNVKCRSIILDDMIGKHLIPKQHQMSIFVRFVISF